MRRIDIPEIDEDAFREAIINAFCHRDYYERDSVNMAVFKDWLEVRSPGGLYGGLTIEQIKNKMVSRRRNEEIADMFHEVRFVEKWGRGISLILDKEPDADFEVVAGIFVTTFKRKHYVPSPAQKTVEKTVVEKFGEKFGENELKVIVLLKQNSKITVLELAGKVGITTRGIEKILQRLKEKGIITRIGPAKGGHWEVKG